MFRSASLFFRTYSYYLRNYYRSKSFYLMLIIAVVVGILLTYVSFKYLNKLSNFATGFGITITSDALKESLLAFLWAFVSSYLPVFASVFFGSPAISSEIESKSAYHIFTLPIPRYILLLGKFFASVTASVIIISIFTLIEFATLQYIFGFVVIQLLYSYLLLVLFILAISGLTFLISSIFNKNTYAYISVLLLYLLIFYAGSIIIEILYKVVPYYLLSEAESIVSRVFINIGFGITFTPSAPVPAGSHLIIESVLIMFLYFFITLGATLIIFERKEVK